MDDKTQEFINDITDSSAYSDCCGAAIISEDICAECYEHCEPQEDD